GTADDRGAEDAHAVVLLNAVGGDCFAGRVVDAAGNDGEAVARRDKAAAQFKVPGASLLLRRGERLVDEKRVHRLASLRRIQNPVSRNVNLASDACWMVAETGLSNLRAGSMGQRKRSHRGVGSG